MTVVVHAAHLTMPVPPLPRATLPDGCRLMAKPSAVWSLNCLQLETFRGRPKKGELVAAMAEDAVTVATAIGPPPLPLPPRSPDDHHSGVDGIEAPPQLEGGLTVPSARGRTRPLGRLRPCPSNGSPEHVR